MGKVHPPFKLPVKEISQPLRAPGKVRLLLLVGTRAGAPQDTWKRDFFAALGTKLASRGWKQLPGVIRKVGFPLFQWVGALM